MHAFGRLIPFPKFYILHRTCFHLPNILSPQMHPPLPEKVHTSILWPGWYETRAYMFLNKQKLTFFNLSRLMRGHVPRKKPPFDLYYFIRANTHRAQSNFDKVGLKYVLCSDCVSSVMCATVWANIDSHILCFLVEPLGGCLAVVEGFSVTAQHFICQRVRM